MRQAHHDAHLAHAFDLEIGQREGDEIVEGAVVERATGRRVAIRAGIPRFVDDEGYAENFGLQWTTFRLTQLDSHTGRPQFTDRFWQNTRWTPNDLEGKTVLEVGAGAGAFTEVLAAAGADLVSVDLSRAIDANRESHKDRGILFAQANLYELPFEPASFDFVFCYGVIQHTPQPNAAYAALWRMVRPGGRLSVDVYAKRRFPDPWYHPKYFWRPITTRLRPERLLHFIEWYVPKWLPVDMAIRRIPKVGPYLVALTMVPCWNHYEMGLTKPEIERWAVMNTFDALGARYDFPKSMDEVKAMIAAPDVVASETFFGSNGIVANVTKSVAATPDAT